MTIFAVDPELTPGEISYFFKLSEARALAKKKAQTGPVVIRRETVDVSREIVLRLLNGDGGWCSNSVDVEKWELVDGRAKQTRLGSARG